MRYNYASLFAPVGKDQGVLRFDRAWQHWELLFTRQSGIAGITYDRNNGTLWIVSIGLMEQVDFMGNTLSSFEVPTAGAVFNALAWDPVSDTLFAHQADSNYLWNWDKSGELLEIFSVNGLSDIAWGGEFVIPSCPADCDLSARLDFADFLCFQSDFIAGDSWADCDQSDSLDFFDFLCFQNLFIAGCD